MYRMANPYSAQEMNTQSMLIDQYAKQAIEYIRMVERELEEFK